MRRKVHEGRESQGKVGDGQGGIAVSLGDEIRTKKKPYYKRGKDGTKHPQGCLVWLSNSKPKLSIREKKEYEKNQNMFRGGGGHLGQFTRKFGGGVEEYRGKKT